MGQTDHRSGARRAREPFKVADSVRVMNSCASRPHQFIGFLMVIATAVPGTAVAQQTPSAADGPWSGQEQCALSTRAPNYQDDQIQTWRITGGPPAIAGSVRNWPGVWGVQGSGSRANPPEHWTVNVPERSVPVSMSDVPISGRVHIASTHAQNVASGALRVSDSTGQIFIASVYEWLQPVVEDAGTATTISGTRTRTLSTGYSWQRPYDAVTTETCTWNFTRVTASAQATATLAPTLTAGTSTAVTATAAPQTTLSTAGAGVMIQPAPGTTTSGTTSTDTTRLRNTVSAGTLSTLSTLLAPITVTYPNGGETLTVGNPIQIAWSYQLPGGTVFTADVSYDGGTTWVSTQSNASTTVSTATLAWTVSGPAAARARIRVRTLDGASADQSDADFIIAGSSTSSSSSTASGSATAPGTGTVRVTAPNGGETWGVGSIRMVEWQTTYGSTQYYDVNYSTDGGATWRRVAERQGTSSPFVVPTPPTSRALINVTAHGGTGDTSDATFSVVSKLTVTSPNGGETLTGGTPVHITWTTLGLTAADPFTAEVSYDSGSTWITTPTASAGSRDLRWMVSGPATTHARIRVRTSDATGAVTDESDADFTIAP